MSRSVNLKRKEAVKRISVKGYLLETCPDKFRFGKDRETLIYKDNPDYVVYRDHAYIFTDDEKHPRRDNIDVLQDIFGYGFVEAVEELERWAIKHNILKQEDQEPVELIEPPSEDYNNGFMIIPDGIDKVEDID